jgi:hypothetical protein
MKDRNPSGDPLQDRDESLSSREKDEKWEGERERERASRR